MSIGNVSFNKRNVFNLSHTRKYSHRMGELVPVLCEDVVPGDTFKIKSRFLVRFSPLVFPAMHEFNLFVRYFFVPYRLVWTDWAKFITGDTGNNDSTVPPQVSVQGMGDMGHFSCGLGSIFDYFGVPNLGNSDSLVVSALPYRAYNLIYNEWYRDQDLQTPVTVLTTNGIEYPTTSGHTNFALQYTNWEKDYFTIARPYQQRGPAVTLPLGSTAPVSVPLPITTVYTTQSAVNNTVVDTMLQTQNVGTIDGVPVGQTTQGNNAVLKVGGQTVNTTADLSTATAATISQVRNAFALQRIAELLMRGGARLTEYIYNFFGVHAPDQRLQRPEYIGGGQQQVLVSEILQTGLGGTPLGTMAGHGISLGQVPTAVYSAREHGMIIGLAHLLPRTAYQQGISRIWTRTTRYDYYNPALAHLSEQAVLCKEIYAASSDGHDNDVYGYTPRYDELRRRESSVHGDFRSSLAGWHAGRIFASRPYLDTTTVSSADVTAIESRLFASTSSDTLWSMCAHDIQAIRPIPKFGEPGLTDHI